MRVLAITLTVALALPPPGRGQAAASSTDWPAYGRDAGGTRFAPLEQISRANVAGLRLVWVYRTGDMLAGRGRFETTPIVVDGTLYLSTSLSRVVALDPATGAERWAYDPHIDLHGDYGDFASRGVSTWLDARAAADAVCRRRIYIGTVDARLIALDAATGQPCEDFADHGMIDLTRDLLNAPDFPGEYEVTSPPAVVGDLVIVGSAVGDNNRTDAPNGVVRAYDARTGAERWSWDPVPRTPGAPGYDTWRGTWAHSTGAANAWSVLSADPAADLVFVPVGSASPDFFGGERLGQNLYANSVVALRASSGAVVWSFQVVHHDLWDYDVPAQPVVFTLRRGGRVIPALAVGTKMGHIFILDRRTGTPLFPVEERPVPQTDVPGEETWPTQPFPPAAFRLVPESLPPSDAWGATPQDLELCRSRIAALRSDGIFTPPSLRGSIHYPGHIGGANWSGLTVDESGGLLIVPSNRLAMVVTLIPRDSIRPTRRAHPGTEISPMRGTPFGMMRETLLTPKGTPCNPPPWTQLTALDLGAGKVKWQVPLAGGPSLGGAFATAGGLVFVAGTHDLRLRAIDEQTGHELWSAPLPAGGNALPMTYLADGRQYVVIAAGGHSELRTTLGDYVLAFGLPGPRMPRPDTLARSLPGTWSGELRVERDSHPATLELRASGDSLVGDLGLVDIHLTGTVAARVQGNAFTFTAPFIFTAKHCEGTITGAGAQANGGRLLVGTLQVSSTCSDHVEPGTFALRRP
jgi:quinoprotein glucose dehydrogenase